ncbi:MAG: MBL fold metallo-hydrolase [Bacteroidales bacterium]
MKRLGLPLDEISYLILTHTHFDHCRSAKVIQDSSSCKIVVSSFAEGSISNGYTAIPKGTNFVTKQISRFGRLVGKRGFGYAPFSPDVLIQDNYIVDSANEQITIIKTPGHSDDSISVILDNDIAIVGDAMFGVLKNNIFPPYADNVQELIQSWNSLLNTECKVFLPGHGKEIKRELLQKEYDRYSLEYNIVLPQN